MTAEREAAGARIRVGRIVRPHGLRGEVVVRGTALAAPEFATLGRVWLVRDRIPGERVEEIAGARGAPGQLIVSLRGVDTLDAASERRGAWIEAERASMPEAGEGLVYHFELLGLIVVEKSGRRIGVVRRVIPTGAHEVLEIETDGGELLLPYHPETVLDWDPSARTLVVQLPEGLEDIYREAPRDRGPRGPAS